MRICRSTNPPLPQPPSRCSSWTRGFDSRHPLQTFPQVGGLSAAAGGGGSREDRGLGTQLGHSGTRAGSLRVPLLLLDQCVEAVREVSGTGVRGVLVDHRCPNGRVAHPLHEFPRRCTGLGCPVVAGVAEVVEVEAGREPGGCDQRRPPDDGTPVASPWRAPTLAGEDGGIRVGGTPGRWARSSSMRMSGKATVRVLLFFGSATCRVPPRSTTALRTNRSPATSLTAGRTLTPTHPPGRATGYPRTCYHFVTHALPKAST